MIAPWPRAIMPGSTARVRRTSARTFRQISASSWSGSSLAKGPDRAEAGVIDEQCQGIVSCGAFFHST